LFSSEMDVLAGDERYEFPESVVFCGRVHMMSLPVSLLPDSTSRTRRGPVSSCRGCATD
jgi:hypothetical protein